MAASKLDQPSRASIDNRTNPDRNRPRQQDSAGDSSSNPDRNRNRRGRRNRENQTELQTKIKEARERLDRIVPPEKKKKEKKNGKGGKKLRVITETGTWEEAPKPEKKEVPGFWSLEVSSVRVAGGVATPLAALGYLGYKVVGGAVEGSATLTDRALKKMADFGEGLINKSLPGMKWLSKMMGRVEKSLGLDKLLVDVLQKDREKRKKLLDKLLKQEADEIKKHKKKKGDAKKKQKAREEKMEKWREKFGEDVAKLLGEEYDEMGTTEPKEEKKEEEKQAA
jgi:hypothetical protein